MSKRVEGTFSINLADPLSLIMYGLSAALVFAKAVGATDWSLLWCLIPAMIPLGVVLVALVVIAVGWSAVKAVGWLDGKTWSDPWRVKLRERKAEKAKERFRKRMQERRLNR